MNSGVTDASPLRHEDRSGEGKGLGDGLVTGS